MREPRRREPRVFQKEGSEPSTSLSSVTSLPERRQTQSSGPMLQGAGGISTSVWAPMPHSASSPAGTEPRFRPSRWDPHDVRCPHTHPQNTGTWAPEHLASATFLTADFPRFQLSLRFPCSTSGSFLLKAIPHPHPHPAPDTGAEDTLCRSAMKFSCKRLLFVSESFPPPQNISKKVSSDDKERKRRRAGENAAWDSGIHPSIMLGRCTTRRMTSAI